MRDALADALRAEIPCDPVVAPRLAALARQQLARLGGTAEDSDQDLLVRLRDPRSFGAFAEVASTDSEVPVGARIAILEHAFDLLPLPRSEADVIEVETRAPPRLLALALRLAQTGGLTVLQVMHLVYAVFLDRSLVRRVPRRVRASLYRHVLAQTDVAEPLRVLYACLHLAAVPEAEAVSEFRWTLRSRALRASLRAALLSVAAAEDGGRAALAAMAQREGLLPGDRPDTQTPEIVANVPRLPDKMGAAARRYLRRRRAV